MRFLSILLLVAAAAAIAPAAASAATTIPVQGFLTGNDDDTPVQGEVTLTVRLHRSADDVDPPLYERQEKVAVSSGLFTVWLGTADQPLDAALFRANPGVHLGIVVNGEELTPRLPLGTSPYAAVAAEAQHATLADTARTAEALDDKAAAAFAKATHRHPWSELDGVPAGLSDGDQMPQFNGTFHSVDIIREGVASRAIGDADRRICFLSGVRLAGINGAQEDGRCELQIANAKWVLIATLKSTDVGVVECTAACFTW